LPSLAKLQGHPFYTIAVTALGTGMRRGELLALRWGDVNLDSGVARVERSLEETKAGLRFKEPKSEHGRRSVSLPLSVVDVLRAYRRDQLEIRVALGLGKLAGEALVFCEYDGTPMPPDKLSRDWSRLVPARKLPDVSFHALRHTHVIPTP
jgi:integrase